MSGLNMNVWVSFCHPIMNSYFQMAGSVLKDMKRDVITLCKYTKEKVYDKRKEECKNNVGTAIGRSQPEICLDIRKKVHKFQGKK